MKSLIIYFSREGENIVDYKIVNLEVGNTEVIAKKIASLTNGHIFKIEPLEKYPSTYDECNKIAEEEKLDGYYAIVTSEKEHIEAHFLTCYLALVLSRVLQYKLDKKYSVGKILESLSKCNCSNYHENYYLFDYYDTVLKDIGNILNINFALKNRALQDIKKILSSSKK